VKEFCEKNAAEPVLYSAIKKNIVAISGNLLFLRTFINNGLGRKKAKRENSRVANRKKKKLESFEFLINWKPGTQLTMLIINGVFTQSDMWLMPPIFMYPNLTFQRSFMYVQINLF
jgi:hypothetical protein